MQSETSLNGFVSFIYFFLLEFNRKLLGPPYKILIIFVVANFEIIFLFFAERSKKQILFNYCAVAKHL